MEVKMLHHTEVREKGAPLDASAAAWEELFQEFQWLAKGLIMDKTNTNKIDFKKKKV